MLLRVAIEPDIALDLRPGKRGLAPLAVRFLSERCLLVGESDGSFAELLRAFEGSSPELCELVLQLVNHRRLRPIPKPAPIRLGALEDADQLASWSELADLLLLAGARVEWLEEMAPGALPEHVTLRDFLNSEAVHGVTKVWERTVKADDVRERVWDERFAPLARQTDDVYIIDRYAVGQLASALKYPARKSGTNGAQWFLGQLARSRIRTIHFASAERGLPHGIGAEEAGDLVAKWFRQQTPTKQLNIHLVGGDFDHGRRLAFDGWAGFDIHNGLASFDHSPIREGFGMNASPELGIQVIAEFKRLVRERG